jgi:hypothetical protein
MRLNAHAGIRIYTGACPGASIAGGTPFRQAATPPELIYGWRPHLRDEGDNHLVELAIAGGAEAIVTPS